MTSIFNTSGTQIHNPFTRLIQDGASWASSSTCEVADQIVSIVTGSADPAESLWQLWDAFFTIIATGNPSPPYPGSPSPYAPYLSLLAALCAHSPTRPSNMSPGSEAESKLRSYVNKDGNLHWDPVPPRFDSQWRDFHDVLEAKRDLHWQSVQEARALASFNDSTIHDTGPDHNPAQYFLSFCIFSATLLKDGSMKGVSSTNVFFACKNVLESSPVCPPTDEIPSLYRISAKQVWALDVRIVAIWLCDGAQSLWDADHDYLRKHYAEALNEPTELWPSQEGLTPERWRLWAQRLRDISSEQKEILDDATRLVVGEAAGSIEHLLSETSREA